MLEYIPRNLVINPLTYIQLIAEGSSKLASVPSGGSGGAAAAPAASGGAAPVVAAVEEKEEEKEVRTHDIIIFITIFISSSRILTGLPKYRSPTRIWASVSSNKPFLTNEFESKKNRNLGKNRICVLGNATESIIMSRMIKNTTVSPDFSELQMPQTDDPSDTTHE